MADKKERRMGKITWFNNSKGYGFIEQDDGEEVFLHFNELQDKNSSFGLQEGDPVSYEPVKGLKGLQAKDVERLDSEGKVLEAKLSIFNDTLAGMVGEGMAICADAKKKVVDIADYVNAEKGVKDARPYYWFAKKIGAMGNKLKVEFARLKSKKTDK